MTSEAYSEEENDADSEDLDMMLPKLFQEYNRGHDQESFKYKGSVNYFKVSKWSSDRGLYIKGKHWNDDETNYDEVFLNKDISGKGARSL